MDTVLVKIFTRKKLCKANGCFILINMAREDMQTSNENLSMCPSLDFN